MELLKSFKPGEVVPASGQYWVVHLTHRPPYKCLLNKGQLFPHCNTCHRCVTFEYASEHLFGTNDLTFDHDFRRAG